MDENEDNTTDNPSTFLNLNHGGGGGDGSISPLEQDVLDEYARLARNMKTLNTNLQTLASGPVTLEIADGLRLLEQKVASVYTLMKASVYSIVLQQGQMDENDPAQGEGSAND